MATVRRLSPLPQQPSASHCEAWNAALSNALIAIVHKDFVADANVCDDHHADEESALRAVTLTHQPALVFTLRHFDLWLRQRRGYLAAAGLYLYSYAKKAQRIEQCYRTALSHAVIRHSTAYLVPESVAADKRSTRLS